MKRALCVGIVVLCLPLVTRAADEEEMVVAAVQRLFDAMAERDPVAARSVLLPEGRLHRVSPDGSLRQLTNEEFVAGLEQGSGRLLERMWEPKVMMHGGVAMLWAPYDFHRDGELSHCGVDVFSLVKTDEGWKIAGTVYTVEQECEPSPLGPVR